MDIEIITEMGDLEKIAPEWDDFLATCENRDVLYSHAWFVNWARAFCPAQDLLILVARSNGAISGILPLMYGAYKNRLIRWRVIQSLTNFHSHRFDLIAPSGSADICAALVERAFAVSKLSVMILDHVPESAAILNILSAGQPYPGKYIANFNYENYLINMEPSFNDYYGRLKSKFRKNVRAAENKALERGALQLLRPSSLKEVDEMLPVFLEMEASGWKGRQKTAIIQDQQARSFYTDLAHSFFKKQWLDLCVLTNAGDHLAFFFSVGSNGILRALKIGINDALRHLGPGMLLTKQVAQELFAEKKVALLDFCGGYARWKSDWGQTREKYYKLFLFRDSLSGSLLYRAARNMGRFTSQGAVADLPAGSADTGDN